MPDFLRALARLSRKDTSQPIPYSGTQFGGIVPASYSPYGPLPPGVVPASGKKVSWSDWDADFATERGFKGCLFVYLAIRIIADAVTSVPWQAVIQGRDGEWNPDPKHPLALLLAKPNKYLSSLQVFEQLIFSLFLGGNGLFLKILSDTRSMQGATDAAVLELWPLPASGWKVEWSDADWISNYVLNQPGNRPRRFDAREIMHVMFSDPCDPHWGMSPLQAAAKEVDVAIQSIAWNMYSMQNRAVSDGAFVSDEWMSDEQWNEARQMVYDQHQGVQNAHVPWVLGGGWKWQQMSLSPVEMDFIQSRKENRSEILALFGVPPVLVGLSASRTDPTDAVLRASQRLLWTQTIVPLLERLRLALQTSLLPHFAPQGRLELRYDLRGVDALREDFESAARTFYMLQRAGITFNDAKKLVGFDLSDHYGDAADKPFGIVNAQQRSAQPAIGMNDPNQGTGPATAPGSPPPAQAGQQPQAAQAGSGSTIDGGGPQ